MSVTNFEIGDLVWAKMKNYPLWPAQISQPPKDEKQKKRKCYVCFLASKINAWVSVDKVHHHAEHLIPPNYEKKPPFLKLAIDEIILLSKDKPLKVAVEEKQQPLEEKQLPADETQLPADETQLPADETPIKGKVSKVKGVRRKVSNRRKSPRVVGRKRSLSKRSDVEETQHPVEETQHPVEETQLPADETQLPVEETPIKGKVSKVKGVRRKVSNRRESPRVVGRKRSLSKRSDVGETSKSGFYTDIIPLRKVRKLDDNHSVSSLSSLRSGSCRDRCKVQKFDDNHSVSSLSSYNSGFHTELIYRKLGDDDDDDDNNNNSVNSSSRCGRYRKKVRRRKVLNLKEEVIMDSAIKSLPTQQKCTLSFTSKHIFVPERQPSPVDNRYEERLRMKHVTPTIKKIGFLGLGRMGRRIVKNLLISGHTVTVWNRTLAKCKEFEKAGATRAENPAEVVMASDIIISCVSDIYAVKAILFCADGVLKGLEDSCAGGKIFKGYVEMSSIGYVASQEIANDIILKGGRYLEAPVTGTKTVTDMGALLILASGNACVFRECVTCFHAIADHAYFLSTEVGAGSKFSIILSMFMGTSYAAFFEILVLANRLKIDISDFLELLNLQEFASKTLLDKGKNILKRDFSFIDTSVFNQHKDIALGLDLGDNLEQPCYIAAAAKEIYNHARLLGYGEHDVAAVYQGVKY